MSDHHGYAWLNSDEWPWAAMADACCFTFLTGLSPAEVLAATGLLGGREVDLRDRPAAAGVFSGEGVAIFGVSDGWVVMFEDNGFPDQFANALAASRGIARAVTVFWNVNSLTEFAYWEAGTRLAGFEFPDEVDGAAPHRLDADMLAVGLTLGDYDDDPDMYRPRMMALAERITGVHLDADFLQRRLIAARVGASDDHAGE